jgi:hypothetical protein
MTNHICNGGQLDARKHPSLTSVSRSNFRNPFYAGGRISGAFDDPPVIDGDGGVDKVAAQHANASQRAVFVNLG